MKCLSANKVLKTLDTFEKKDYQKVVKDVNAVYDALPDTEKENNNPRADFAGCLLRLAGHDFMDFRYDREQHVKNLSDEREKAIEGLTDKKLEKFKAREAKLAASWKDFLAAQKDALEETDPKKADEKRDKL